MAKLSPLHVGKPIFLLGPPRTGTSWVGKVFSSAPGTRYLREPITQGPKEIIRDAYKFRYLKSDDTDVELDTIWTHMLSIKGLLRNRHLLANSRTRFSRFPLVPARLIVKEVSSIFSLEWLARRYDPNIVVTIRHPCGFVASVSRLSSIGHPAIELDWLLNQNKLMKEYFSDLSSWIQSLTDPLERWTAAYAMCLKVLADQAAKHDDWIVVKHETLCESPEHEFQSLFERLGLRYTDEVDRFLMETSRTDDDQIYSLNRDTRVESHKWKHKYTVEQIGSIRGVYDRFDLPWYGDDSWTLDDSCAMKTINVAEN